MATQQQILDLTLLADAYLLELGEEMYNKQVSGCDGSKESKLIQQIIMLIGSLEHRVEVSQYDKETDALYECLLKAIGAYSGAGLPVDPNADIPNLIIDVIVISDGKPTELTFFWNNFVDSTQAGRIRYNNVTWAGWNPILSVDNMPFLQRGVDYVLISTGGFELLPTGNVPFVYNGQIIRAVGFEPAGSVPTGSYVDNNYWISGYTV